MPIPIKKYNIIYADPPWSYYNDSNATKDVTTTRGMRRPPYSVLSSRNIMSLPIKEISSDNSILFIWTTDYHLLKCMEVIKEWGFQYKTIGFVWLKTNKSGKPITFMGAYTMKSGAELCLLATRGKNAHRLVKNHRVKALIISKREEHSKKPSEVRERIVALIGNMPRIELFAREKPTDWDVWGNEVKSDIELGDKR